MRPVAGKVLIINAISTLIPLNLEGIKIMNYLIINHLRTTNKSQHETVLGVR